MVKEENTLSFHEDAKEIRKEQIEAQITRILKQEDIKIQKAVVRLLDDGTIQSIEIITENKEKQEKKIKTILLRFYNLKDSNINVSEQRNYDRERQTETNHRNGWNQKDHADAGSWDFSDPFQFSIDIENAKKEGKRLKKLKKAKDKKIKKV